MLFRPGLYCANRKTGSERYVKPAIDECNRQIGLIENADLDGKGFVCYKGHEPLNKDATNRVTTVATIGEEPIIRQL